MTNRDKQNRELRGVVYYHELDKRKKPLFSDCDTIALVVFVMLALLIGGWPV